ncbi:Uncharacterised protein [Campylobacter geochelonis]|nr:Uncharacterised protein [Campylobacter geochelonis]
MATPAICSFPNDNILSSFPVNSLAYAPLPIATPPLLALPDIATAFSLATELFPIAIESKPIAFEAFPIATEFSSNAFAPFPRAVAFSFNAFAPFPRAVALSESANELLPIATAYLAPVVAKAPKAIALSEFASNVVISFLAASIISFCSFSFVL